jgi:hypothetical protein
VQTHRDADRRDIAYLFTQASWNQETNIRGSGERFFMHSAPGGTEKVFSQTYREPANHNPLRVEHVYHNGESVTEPLACLVNDACGNSVTFRHGLADVAGGELIKFVLKRRLFPGRQCGSYGICPVQCHTGAAGPAFHRPRFPVTAGSIHGEANMAQFSRHSIRTSKDVPIQNQSRAKSGSEREKNHVPATSACAELMLRDSPGIGVVLNGTTYAEFFFKDRLHRNRIPRRQIGGLLDDAGNPVERAATADPNSLWKRTCFGKSFTDQGYDLLHRMLPAQLRRSRKLLSPKDVGSLSAQDDRGFRTTDIDTDKHRVVRETTTVRAH